jgi:ABC-type amino acid transport substrate-binding protein
MKNREGQWEGISIELWDLIAKKLNLKYEWREHTLKTLLDGVADRSLDVGIAAITITADRETKFDFTHSYYTTGLSIAIPKKSSEGWWAVIRGLFSYRMLAIVSVLGFILLVIGTITWLLEKKRNPENFNPNPIKGIASGIWWAAVTMTTVGYGDMTPKTLGGRMIALFWMFASLLLVSSIIAGVASTLTVAKMEQLISTPEDLARGKVVSIKHSVSDTYLRNRRIYPLYVKNVSEGLLAIKEGSVDAMVYDAPLLHYIIKEKYPQDLMVTEALFESQNYGIALPENSPLRERINRKMLEIISSAEWGRIKHKYLGE